MGRKCQIVAIHRHAKYKQSHVKRQHFCIVQVIICSDRKLDQLYKQNTSAWWAYTIHGYPFNTNVTFYTKPAWSILLWYCAKLVSLTCPIFLSSLEGNHCLVQNQEYKVNTLVWTCLLTTAVMRSRRSQSFRHSYWWFWERYQNTQTMLINAYLRACTTNGSFTLAIFAGVFSLW